MNTIDRSNVNDSKVKAQDFPKSGFDMSYKSRMDFILGRLIPSGFQHIMPADKFSGSTDVKYTFNTLQVPEISDVEVSQHNFYVPYRAIDKSFIDGIVPTELNSMSASWHTPTFNLKDLIYKVFGTDDSFYIMSAEWTNAERDFTPVDYLQSLMTITPGSNPPQPEESLPSNYVNIMASCIRDSLINNWLIDNFYNADFVDDYIEHFVSTMNTLNGSTTIDKQWITTFLTALLEPVVGRGSLLDLLGYQYLRSYDIDKIADSLISAYADGENPVFTDFIDDTIEQNEYAIRAYYAIWYEWYRDKNLEKRSSDLPDWRDFGSSTILTEQKAWCFLPLRIRSWQKDMFVGSMPDDISRHVYAPIIDTASNPASVSFSRSDYLNAESQVRSDVLESGFVNARYYSIEYLNPINGSPTTISCPVPSAVNDSLIAASSLTAPDSLILDLRDLRKSQMLERYLKRNFYFGDEYQDRMLAHYGSKVSDNSIRRPHLLSSSVSSVNPQQEVANMSNDVVKAGTRTATAQDSAHGDAFEFFAEEFGIVINILSIRPIAQYQGLCPQNLLYKQTDFPLPEFANNNDEFGRVLEIACSGYNNSTGNPQVYQFGHYPYAHAYRSRVDEVHGSFVDDKIDYTFARFFGNADVSEVPKLNYRFIHCRPRLGMFYDTIRLSGQGYMTCDHHFYVERVLPTPVEEI